MFHVFVIDIIVSLLVSRLFEFVILCGVAPGRARNCESNRDRHFVKKHSFTRAEGTSLVRCLTSTHTLLESRMVHTYTSYTAVHTRSRVSRQVAVRSHPCLAGCCKRVVPRHVFDVVHGSCFRSDRSLAGCCKSVVPGHVLDIVHGSHSMRIRGWGYHRVQLYIAARPLEVGRCGRAGGRNLGRWCG